MTNLNQLKTQKSHSMNRIALYLVVLLPLLISGCFTSGSSTQSTSSTYDCVTKDEWFTNPSMPTRVEKSEDNGKSSSFCDFYQFSTQAYIYLMSPSKKDPSLRNFQDTSKYPLLEFEVTETAKGPKFVPVDSCDGKISGSTLRTSLDKTISSFSTGQAGGGNTIYDQNGNVVFYEVRFNQELCNLTSSATEMAKQKIFNFPSGTTEIKLAWKVLTNNETSSTQTPEYVTQTVDGVTYGLVGMHIAIATKDHPEFVWATYEHLTNSPNCNAQGSQSQTNWSFASADCTKDLPDSLTPSKKQDCKFNSTQDNLTAKHHTPTNICRVHPYGTATGDFHADVNLANIVSQNENIYESLTRLDVAESLNVLTNYFNVGDIWVSDTEESSGGAGVPNERGSLRLANTVAETVFQDVNLNSKDFSSNCFGCHNYIGSAETINNNITSFNLSHIFKDIKIGKGDAIDVTAPSSIADNSMAPSVCGGSNGVCKQKASYLRWNNQWTNINPGAGSVCGCELDPSYP